MKFFHFPLVLTLGLLSTTVPAYAQAANTDDKNQTGTAVVSTNQELQWWQSVGSERQAALANLFEPSWFENSLADVERISYSYVAQMLYDFVASGVDSHPHDSYVGFAPLLLRASFHAAGTFHAPSGTGGTDGGTIFSSGELQDDSNACIDKATQALEQLYKGSHTVSMADAMVIAGSVALDTMGYPRMDLLKITGGRKDIAGVASRGRLPNPDDNPLKLFQESYNLTAGELTALIGGAHNFGSSHGVCSGYVGSWTSDPLQWASLSTGKSEFFVDLLQEDWRWYKVCTYKNGTSTFASIEDPFESGAIFEDEHSEEEEIDLCALEGNAEPFICEEQAMRGCDFEDGSYDPLDPPCDPAILHMRLKADYFLRVDPVLRPHALAYFADDELLAQEFGVAYHKLTHAGLYRCGLTGFGCGDYGVCKDVVDPVTQEHLTSYCVVDPAFVVDIASSSFADDEVDDDDWHLSKGGSIAVLVALGTMSLIIVLLVNTILHAKHPTSEHASSSSSAASRGDATPPHASKSMVESAVPSTGMINI